MTVSGPGANDVPMVYVVFQSIENRIYRLGPFPNTGFIPIDPVNIPTGTYQVMVYGKSTFIRMYVAGIGQNFVYLLNKPCTLNVHPIRKSDDSCDSSSDEKYCCFVSARKIDNLL